MTLLIDGHNLIGAMPGIDIADPDDEWQLVLRLRNYAAGRGRPVTVVFDSGAGPPPNWNLTGSGVTVRFASPGVTADAVILSMLRRSKRPRQVIVVTNDRDLASLVRAEGGQVRSASQFASQLEAPLPAAAPSAEPGIPSPDPRDPAYADIYDGFLAAEKDHIHFKGATIRTAEDCIETLYEGRPAEAQDAARWLGRIGGEEAVGPLLDALTHTNGSVRAAALLALATLGNPRVIDAAADRLAGDPSGMVREAAAQCLARFPGPKAEGALEAALTDPKARVRRAAKAGLARLQARK